MERKSVILVIGESIQDEFIYCSADRLSPEACCPVVKELFRENNEGGAANVVNNLRSLGCKDVVFVHQDNKIIKTRYVHKSSGHHIIRIDEEKSCKPLDIGQLVQSVDSNIEDVQMIVISDYCKGLITEQLISDIRNTFTCDVIIDTKKKAGVWIKDVDFIKINKKEFNENFLPYNVSNQIGELLKTTNRFVTLGENGVYHFNTDSTIKTKEREANCVSGAGDSYLAGFVTKYLNCKDINQSLLFANEVASIAVSKRGVVSVSEAEVNDL
jgi:D-beta-D-heptose 7-phosphate kinase/D-beta-D-heptose 1-phosphate adenosyltransferase